MENEKREIIWENLTEEEKYNYLMFWFRYYGGALFTLEEYEMFSDLIEIYADKIFDHICTLSAYKNTIQSTLLLNCMRQRNLDELFSHNLTISGLVNANIESSKKGKVIDEYNSLRKFIIKEIDKNFKNPEPDIPLGSKK